MRKFFVTSVVFAVVFSLVPQASAFEIELFEAPISEVKGEHIQNEVLVKFKGTDRFQRVKARRGERVEALLERYRSRLDVEYAEPNYIAHTLLTPNDPYYSYQWHLFNTSYGGIQLGTAWDTTSGSDVVVAVVDTGVAYENYQKDLLSPVYYKAPDLASTQFVAGYDFVENDTHPNDDEGHGTHVTGTIAQSTNNGLGVAGVAYGAKIMPVKVLNKQGSGTYADIADGIRFAADNGAEVINLSLGGSSPSSVLEDALAYAYINGVTIVAAAGNSNSSAPSYPAAYDAYVISVGATRYDETRAPYSNYGSTVDVVAPGGDLTIDQNNDGYGDGVLQQTFGNKVTNQWGYYFYQGTSMASPHIAGVAALVLSIGGTIDTPSEVREVLQSTADDIGSPGKDTIYGYGLVNAAAAVGVAFDADASPEVSIINPVSGAVLAGVASVSVNASDDTGVTRVDFFADGNLFSSDDVSPYVADWDSTSVLDGVHELSAQAFDTASQTTTARITIQVDNVNELPIANAGADQSVLVGQSVSFNGSGSSDPDGTINSYAWDFGDGSVASGVGASHTYTATGIYTVTLTVTDNRGGIALDTALVTVAVTPLTNVKLTSVSARNVKAFKSYRVDATAKNFESAKQTISFHIDIYNPSGVKVSWLGLSDKTRTISSGGSKSVAWSGVVTSGSNGVYTAKASVLKNGTVLDTKTATFTVSGF